MNFAWNIEHEQAFASEISNIFFMEIIEHCEHEHPCIFNSDSASEAIF